MNIKDKIMNVVDALKYKEQAKLDGVKRQEAMNQASKNESTKEQE